MENKKQGAGIEVDPDRTIELTRSLVRRPSPLWGESAAARFLAAYLQGTNLDVELQPVSSASGRHSHQTVARLRGARPGPKTLLCGHLDTSGWGEEMYRADCWTVEPYAGDLVDGWLYGVGSLNMKGGIAALVGATEALVHLGPDLRGEIVIAGVMGETGGGVGVLHLLHLERDFDQAIVAEPTNLSVATISVGYIQGWIRLWGELRHFEPYPNPISAMAPVLEALGSAYIPLDAEGWATFKVYPDLPGYPRLAVRSIASGQDDCAIFFDMRTVPGQTEESVRVDLEALLERLTSRLPDIRAEVVIPASPEAPNFPAMPAIPRKHELTQVLINNHTEIHGEPPQTGAGDRIGLASDASHLKAAGIPTIDYGPGKHPVWPMVDERIWAADIVKAAQVLAATLLTLHG